ncbi:Arginine/lysine/ornithine decarboxylase [Butyrivibrio sp. ob235]|uniref:aminotransferase class I/II-fold pyridoxal phosphate-dependent enzyme n=1 Tax=Butyrivibrio sp. ob235 TaxID=1761780 RepID=UPI0008B78FBD|nr:aminotransferase class V-fold PLP-dependent enzyme [Butyrivibrio sp. ob235]SEL58675.1 Arginine/lysine/ornithine decarboxylase [Butyrivibrio sp. ob235]
MKKEESLRDCLENLKNSDLYPFHMPGHKRNPGAGEMARYMDIDITEIDDYDNLHDADGIILRAEERANALYGADETHFLVNGSSSGVLAAISAVAGRGEKIIAGRNAHKSFYHAVYLRELDVTYILPDPEGLVNPKDIEDAFDKNPGIKAVFITSPTYEGMVSDVKKIAQITHKNGAILVVDEAHGAHFGLYKKLPESSVTEGADIVIHSLHKTLAAMTQTALIHVKGDRVDREKLRRFLRIYQTSSPSYVLMASIDSCIKDINDNGKEVFERLIYFRKWIEAETADLTWIRIPHFSKRQDPGKVLICSADGAITGQRIYDILRLEYKLQPEMAGDTYALAIITGYDTEDGISRLIEAVKELDTRIENEKSNCLGSARNKKDKKENIEQSSGSTELPKTVIPFYKAWDAAMEEIDLTRAAGRIAGDFINLYPPGIPLVIPGEAIDKELVRKIGEYINDGRNVQGVKISAKGERTVKVVAPM